MIVSAVKGGLGNMMFQIAAGSSLAKDVGTDYAYTYDLWGSSTSYDIAKYPTTIFKNISKVSVNNLKVNEYRKYVEPSFEYQKIPQIDNLLLDGYFQSQKYFGNKEDYIRKLFVVDINDLYKDYTFLHVRRKDYLKFKDVHPVCTVDYYNKALEFITPEKCIIISDDIQWCKENFTSSQFEFSESIDDLQDLSTMKSCKNGIISNSTFSWWGAALSEKQKVVAPSVWFGPQGPKSWSDVYCNTWKII
jgi:hypothetical protein